MHRIILLVFILSLLAITGGCGGGNSSGNGGGTPPQNTANVGVVNNAAAPMGFSFNAATVKSGAQVTWVNQSSAPHSIVWDSQTPGTSPAPGAGIGRFDAGSNSTGWTAPTVSANTTYAYHCGIHGPTMAGTIVVTP